MRWIAIIIQHTPAPDSCPQIQPSDKQRLWQIASRFTPTLVWRHKQHAAVNTSMADGLLMEVESSLTLFEGPQGLAKSLWNELSTLNCQLNCQLNCKVNYQLGCAHTAQGAWWKAQAAPCQSAKELCHCLENPTLSQSELQALPVTVLDLEPNKLRTLQQCGLHKLGALLELPRDHLARRVGTSILTEIDCALGRQTESYEIAQEKLVFTSRLEMPFHSTALPLIEQVIGKLLNQLENWCKKRQLATNVLNWQLHMPHDTLAFKTHSARLLQRASDWKQLLHYRLTRLQLADEVHEISLRCDTQKSAVEHNLTLLPEQSSSEDSWLQVCDELRQRLGNASIAFIQAKADPRPEFASVLHTSAARGSNRAQTNYLSSHAQWPLMLLTKPERLLGASPNWKAKQGWRLLSGPERVEFGWWSQQPVYRDYYKAINPDRVVAWVFQDLNEHPTKHAWYIHGYFA